MSGTRGAAVLVMAAAVLGETGCRATERPGVIESVLASRPEWFAAVVDRAEEHRLQILYTQVDRDEKNRPRFHTHGYRVDATRYFYPASAVKLPVALLALEKLNDLAVPGLGRDTPLRVEPTTPGQTGGTADHGTSEGRPTIGQYVEKVFLVSDNDAFNRLYEFVGQRAINERLWEMGYTDARILRRVGVRMTPEENRTTNPFVFFGPDGSEVYRQPMARNPEEWRVDKAEVRQGRGHYEDGRLIDGPLDFSFSNDLSVEDLQGILKAALYPEAVPRARRFRLKNEDYRFLYRAMSMLPRESRDPSYRDRDRYPDGYVKFFLLGDSKAPMPRGIRIFNKVGQAYGYLIDNACIVDFEAGVEFLLTAVVQVNANQVLNDDTYEYGEVGLPFLANLGRAMLEYERRRERPRRPDLSRLAVDD